MQLIYRDNEKKKKGSLKFWLWHEVANQFKVFLNKVIRAHLIILSVKIYLIINVKLVEIILRLHHMNLLGFRSLDK